MQLKTAGIKGHLGKHKITVHLQDIGRMHSTLHLNFVSTDTGIVKTLKGSCSDSLYVFSILMGLFMFLVHLPNKYKKNLGPTFL